MGFSLCSTRCGGVLGHHRRAKTDVSEEGARLWRSSRKITGKVKVIYIDGDLTTSSSPEAGAERTLPPFWGLREGAFTYSNNEAGRALAAPRTEVRLRNSCRVTPPRCNGVFGISDLDMDSSNSGFCIQAVAGDTTARRRETAIPEGFTGAFLNDALCYSVESNHGSTRLVYTRKRSLNSRFFYS